jgi:DNA processing protein
MRSDPALRRAAISWARSALLTPQRLWRAAREHGGIESLLAAGPGELSEWLGSEDRAAAFLRSAEDSDSERWAAQVERSGVHVLTIFEDEYPKALSEISDPPFVLYAIGRLDRLKLPAVGIVGSRAATRYGRDVAARLARDLSAAGVTIVSGFARGVDHAAHEAALGLPGGTVAVLGCGLDVNYPREHAALKESMKTEGLLLSEFPPGAEPRPEHFPIRNRIIAGLCSGVVVVEASRRSGSLITARLANESGRDVFAVPGSVFSQTSVGTHELLRDGAILCRGAEDVLSELFLAIGAASSGIPAGSSAAVSGLSDEARRIWETLRKGEYASAEELAQSTDLPAATVLAALFELEKQGLYVFAEEADTEPGGLKDSLKD